MTLHTIAAYDKRILALEAERDRLLGFLKDIRACLHTGKLDINDMQRTINAAVSIADLALKGEK